MKKLKFLPLLLVAPLLIGCNNVKSPKFADNGEEVAGDKFMADLAEKSLATAYNKEDALPSLAVKSKRSSKEYSARTRKDAGFKASYERNYSTTTSMKYDAANVLMDGKVSSKTKRKEVSNYGKEIGNEKESRNMFYQEFAKGDKKYLVMGTKEEKKLQAISQVTEENPASKVMDMFVKTAVASQGSDLNNLLNAYAGSTEEEQKNYKFYENGNIFTVEYKYSVENEESKDGEDKVIYVTNASYYKKAQVDLTDGKWKALFWNESSVKQEYKQDYGIYFEGDVYESKDLTSEETIAEYKDAKLKAQDVSGYKDNIPEA